jgi:hypothetical protein
MKTCDLARAAENDSMDHRPARARKPLDPPPGLDDHVSRREAAALLGFASEFKVRELERRGRLQATRGAMGSAWYPRAAVLALRLELGRRVQAGAPPAEPADEELLALLSRPRQEHGVWRARTPLDLVREAGLSVERAERIYGFWLRYGSAAANPGAEPPAAAWTEAAARTEAVPAPSAERRGLDRLERDRLLRDMRDPRPDVRDAAFAALKHR